MLKVVVRPHRTKLAANHAEPQKVFVMVKTIPSPEVAMARPPLALYLVIDTSRSMRMFVDQEAAQRAAARASEVGVAADGAQYHSLDSDLPTLLDQAIEAAHAMVDDARLLPTDQISIVQFDDDAKVLLPLTSLSYKANAHAAIELLRDFAGETRMAQGLEKALGEVQQTAPEVAKRVFVLTDGATADERKCHTLLPQFAASNAPIIAIGFGPQYKEELMARMADATQGRPYHLKAMGDLVHEVLEREVGQTTREVVTDLKLNVKTALGVRLDKIHRAHPSLSQVAMDEDPFRLGNIAAGDFTVFILEFTVEGPPRSPSRVRLAQLCLSGSTPGTNATRELPPQDVVVEFAGDVTSSSPIDAEVIGYVQQKNVSSLVDNAMRAASSDPARAQRTLQAAASVTQNLGNAALSSMIDEAAQELGQTGAISPQTAKTVALGTRTRTVRTSAVDTSNTSPTAGLSPEEIRRLSGT